GYSIGIGGVVTFKNARVLKEVAADLPLDRIVVETDCPYLSPVPNRGKRNSSLNLPYVIQTIAEIRGMTPEEVEKATFENACHIYGIK
ncbi:MAG: TatD family hydrolase, partial [Candidatus Neoclostridium sp.]